MEASCCSLSPPPSAAACSICRDAFSEASATVMLVCGHVFHRRCCDEWLKQSPTCPQCRRKLRIQQREVLQVFLSFGEASAVGDSGSGPDDVEAPGLAELRANLAAEAEQRATAERRLKRQQRVDAQRRRDLEQRQRQIATFTAQLGACQQSLADQEAENGQLLQLMELEHQELSAVADRTRKQLDEERFARKQLEERLRQAEWDLTQLRAELRASQLEAVELMESVQAEKADCERLMGQLLNREAENFDLSKRLQRFHESSAWKPAAMAGWSTAEGFSSLPVIPQLLKSDPSDGLNETVDKISTYEETSCYDSETERTIGQELEGMVEND